jgi:hypothetical protein
VNKKVQTVEQQQSLVVLDLSFGNFLHFSRCGLTSFERRFLEECEESFHVLIKISIFSFELFLVLNGLSLMDTIPYLHVSMSHVEKLADLLVLLLPIFPLTSPGTIHSGLARSTVLEHDIRRCYSVAYDAALRHDCCWSRVRVVQCSK